MSQLEEASGTSHGAHQSIQNLRRLTRASWIITAACAIAGVGYAFMIGNVAAVSIATVFLPVAFIVTAIAEHAKVNIALNDR